MSEKWKKGILAVWLTLILASIWFPVDCDLGYVERKVYLNEITYDAEQISWLTGDLLNHADKRTADEIIWYLERFLSHETWHEDAMHYDWLKETSAYKTTEENIELKKVFDNLYIPALKRAAVQVTTEDRVILERLQSSFRNFHDALRKDEKHLNGKAYSEQYTTEQLNRCIEKLTQ